MAIRVLLVDDHSVVRQGLRMFLGLDAEIDVVGEGRDGAEGLRLLATGQSNKEIARNLSVNESTIKSHVSSILSKLGVQGRTQAALHALRIGLVPTSALDKDR